MKGIKQNENVKTKEERTAGRNKNHDGLTTSVHSHSSMSSMTEAWPPTPYGGSIKTATGGQRGAAMPSQKNKNPAPNTTNNKTSMNVKFKIIEYFVRKKINQ